MRNSTQHAHTHACLRLCAARHSHLIPTPFLLFLHARTHTRMHARPRTRTSCSNTHTRTYAYAYAPRYARAIFSPHPHALPPLPALTHAYARATTFSVMLQHACAHHAPTHTHDIFSSYPSPSSSSSTSWAPGGSAPEDGKQQQHQGNEDPPPPPPCGLLEDLPPATCVASSACAVGQNLRCPSAIGDF